MTGISLMWLTLEKGPSKSQLEWRRENISQNFSLKKVSGMKSTSGFCCWDLSPSYFFQPLYYFCISIIEFSLCVCHYAYLCSQTHSQPIKAFSTQNQTLFSGYQPCSGGMPTQCSSHQLSWTLHYTPLGSSRLNDDSLDAVKQQTHFTLGAVYLINERKETKQKKQNKEKTKKHFCMQLYLLFPRF